MSRLHAMGAAVPHTRTVVFDRSPPYAARKGFKLTVGRPYPARVVNEDLRLYEVTDDGGAPLRVSMYGRSYANGGHWHLLEDEPLLAAQA